MARYSFEFRSAYRGDVDYIAWVDGNPRRIELRTVNGGPVASYVGAPVPPDVLDAFNTWRAEKHAENIAYMRARPDRYALTPDILTPPAPARARVFQASEPESTR